WYGLRLTPEPQRSAMYAIYAWMREADDLADAEGIADDERVRRIAQFRHDTDAALAGRPPGGRPTWRALAWVAAHHDLAPRDFHDMLDGQLGDVGPVRFQTWDDLRGFCYRVASTVGLVCIRVWGYSDPAATALAVDRGIAFQLTNILRDYREDFDQGRVYLPAEDFRRMDLTPEMLRRWSPAPQCEEFMRAQCDRAAQFYERSAPLDAMVTPSCVPTLWAMTEIYRALLGRIQANPSAVVGARRVRVPSWRKAFIAWRASRRSREAAR
ncbi:MAG: phytoene/squalene synthase family protein, partial [Phycisphaerales bacterium]